MLKRGSIVQLTTTPSRKTRETAVRTAVVLSDSFLAGGLELCPIGFFSPKHGAWARVALVSELREVEHDSGSESAPEKQTSRSYLPEYRIWINMRRRCSDPRHQEFHNYAGRVRVCQAWEQSFDNFYRDVGPRPSPKHSLDRVNNEGNYEPGNVRWATAKEQARNTSRTRMLSVQGVTKPLVEWAEEVGISPQSLKYRLSSGWPVEDAVSRPGAKSKPFRLSADTRRKRGTECPLSRLRETDVREILLARKTGSSIRSIAKQHGVSYANVRCIVNRVTWKHVTLPEE